jgi:hypothetical protein
MELAGVEVLLDILRLSVGVNINHFMKSGIEASDSIFWIGTPHLVKRISFNSDNRPTNPATIEFCLIRDKIRESPHSLRPLHFLGDNPEASFPPLTITSPPIPSTMDFRNDRDYFKSVPQLAAAVLGVAELPEYKRMFRQYCARMQETEATFTFAAIARRLETTEIELQRERTKKEEQLQHLLSKIPESLLLELEGTKEAQTKAFHTLLSQIQSLVLSKSSAESQSLELYIPLKGGAHLDTPPHLYFDVEQRFMLPPFFYS